MTKVTEQHLAAIDGLLGEVDMAELVVAVHARKRHADHLEVKKGQPALGVELPKEQWDRLVAAMRAPLTAKEATASGVDYLCGTVQDCIDAGDYEDALFALIRLWRKVWAMQPHLGPIEGK